MINNVITKVKWFWAWQDDKEEEWLHQMALQGWHLFELTFPTIYKFKQGKPANMYYRLDFKANTNKDMESYKKLFADAGLEHCGMMGGWQYFRKETAKGEETEIYSDNDSKIRKYQYVLYWLMIVTLPIFIVLDDLPKPFLMIYLVIILLCIYAIVRLILKIGSLKKL